MRGEIVTLIKKYTDSDHIKGRVLDVCSAGDEYCKAQGYDLKKYFRDRNIEYKTLDLFNTDGVDYIMDAEKMEFKDEFDAVLLTEALEHIENPWEVVNRCYNAAKKGGVFVCTAPQIYKVHALKDFYRFYMSGMKAICKKWVEIESGSWGQEDGPAYEHYYVGQKA